MDVIDGMQIEEIFCVYMEYGDDFHECIERVAREKDIRAGAILSGIADAQSEEQSGEDADASERP